MKNCISVLVITFVLTSCGHGTTQHFPKGKGITNPAEIVIVRNKNLWCGGQSTIIFFDGLKIAQLRIGEYVSFYVAYSVHRPHFKHTFHFFPPYLVSPIFSGYRDMIFYKN